MFSFWNRKSNKSPAAGRTSNVLPQPFEQNVDIPAPAPRPPPRQSSANLEEPSPPPRPAPAPVIPAVETPHDVAVAEVQAKILQVEQLPPIARSLHTPPNDPLSEASAAPKPPAEPLFDPATGAQRGFFEPVSVGGLGDGEFPLDEAWTHLARIRELQSEIAAMHMRVEGIGDGGGSMDLEVDVDVDTVPTQEEEEAAKRDKEFSKLPGRFKGRSDDIDAMMTKLDALSQAVIAFHDLQPPPLNFDSAPTSRENTYERPPPGEHAIPVSTRMRPGVKPAALFGTRILPGKTQIAEVLHDSPVSTHEAPLLHDEPPK